MPYNLPHSSMKREKEHVKINRSGFALDLTLAGSLRVEWFVALYSFCATSFASALSRRFHSPGRRPDMYAFTCYLYDQFAPADLSPLPANSSPCYPSSCPVLSLCDHQSHAPLVA